MVTEYESRQAAEIEAWKRAKPAILSRRFGTLPKRFNWAVEQVVPYIPLSQTFGWLDRTAVWLSDERAIVREAGVSQRDELQEKDLNLSDRLAEATHRWAMGLAAAEGAVTGVTGLMGLVADIPAVVTLALRTIYRTGLCYGFDVKTEREVALGILAVSGANTMEEKTEALTRLEATLTNLNPGAGGAAANVTSIDQTKVTAQQLARQLSVNLAKRKALQTVPMIGALVGGSVNAWYIRDVSLAARRVFQDQWLRQNHKLAHVAA